MPTETEDPLESWEFQLYLLDEERAAQSAIDAIMEQEWIEIFPGAKDLLPKILEEREADAAALRELVKRRIAGARGAGPIEEYRTRLSLLIGEGADYAKVQEDIARLKYQIAYASGAKQKKVNGRLKEEDIDKARCVPITRVLNVRRDRRSGQQVQTRCPLHPDKTPSFTIYGDNNYHCFGCNAHGDVITLIQRLHRLSFVDAIHYINKYYV